MNWNKILLFSVTVLILVSCEKDSEEISGDNQTADLVQALDQELESLTNDPLLWSDDELAFLDPLVDKSIIGLGEATHGTAEFFKAKHRIFQYLVENHDFKIFAIEADFGESLLINDYIQRGATNELEELMVTKMHFWTWKTEEVKDFLLWMSKYNLNKTEEEKIQYMGVDCQFNTFHPGMVKDYLELTEAPFFFWAEQILDEAETATNEGFDSYSNEAFEDYLLGIDALLDSITTHGDALINVSSNKEYQLCVRLATVIRQVSEVSFSQTKEDYSIYHRDQYMAENTVWLQEYFNGEKVILWAHNGHIANNPNYFRGGSQGNHISQAIGNDYASIGFLFSKGSFTAIERRIGHQSNLGEQVIDVEPKENSLNFAMSHSKESVFTVKISDLEKYDEWNDVFSDGIEYFEIGSVYNNKPEDYYGMFDPDFFDYIIYFDESTASVLLQ